MKVPDMKLDLGVVRWAGEMRRVVVQPGDVLVVSCPTALSPQQRDRLRQELAEVFPIARAMVLEAGVTIGVLQPEHDKGG